MQIHVGSKHLAADVAVALDVTGREHLVIVAKATWSIPAPGQRPRPLEPEPLALTDVFYGQPGESALRYGSDYARFKPRCDVVFDACAHAPGGQAVRQMDVAVQVGSLVKRLRVHGPRRWQRALGTAQLSAAEPFTTLPLHYGLAFGGTRAFDEGGQRVAEAFAPNPVGLGFVGKQSRDQLHGLAAPQLEAPDRPVTRPDGKEPAVALSAVASNFAQRMAYVGTYDEQWAAHVAPFLPEDFDERFHQIAPPDQQVPYPSGGDLVVLQGLLPEHARLSFKLPALQALPVRVLRTDYSVETREAPVDTLFFETEAHRWSAVWRASVPLRRRIQEVDSIAVGSVAGTWWRNRRLGLEQEGGCPGCDDAPAPDLVHDPIQERAD